MDGRVYNTVLVGIRYAFSVMNGFNYLQVFLKVSSKLS